MKHAPDVVLYAMPDCLNQLTAQVMEPSATIHVEVSTRLQDFFVLTHNEKSVDETPRPKETRSEPTQAPYTSKRSADRANHRVPPEYIDQVIRGLPR